jgi:hypothetical protein
MLKIFLNALMLETLQNQITGRSRGNLPPEFFLNGVLTECIVLSAVSTQLIHEYYRKKKKERKKESEKAGMKQLN